MKTIQRFFVTFEVKGDQVIVSDPTLLHQARHVMRSRISDTIILLDNTGYEYVCTITDLQNRYLQASLISKEISDNEPNTYICLFQSLLKAKDRFEWSLQKGTEVGVSAFIPLRSQRCELKGNMNMERMKSIVREAAEQSHRARLPALKDELHFAKALSQVEGIKIIFDASGIPLSDFLHSHPVVKDQESKINAFSLFIGPEGGFTAEEIEKAKASGAVIVSLGQRVLRSETAGVVAASLLLYSLEGRL